VVYVELIVLVGTAIRLELCMSTELFVIMSPPQDTLVREVLLTDYVLDIN